MATKTITIMEDAYEMLVRQKEEGESFSDTIRRIFLQENKKTELEDLFGVWSKKTGDAVKKEIELQRIRDRKRTERRDKKFTALTRRS